ncbi:hypothetical protein Mal4_27220 [Maioricimonas rarisocia]|uniref:BioF2-like acetyltransferase domain-containing protein n=1 Tax=Maioricimonas rarisocia TaxID=2528026 RepID=A0A517Z7E5_9PLAN|nr:GNAT family N-acetyltransferase [Maioricimonas rarisocia]QDU38395.1 hypothetical protein Mal4_27220 [Maioricimonas rarisocia]
MTTCIAAPDRPATPSASAPITLRVFGRDELVAGLERWKQLEAALDSASLASSYDWTAAWLAHYADLIPSQIVVAERGTETVGTCLITEGVGRRVGPFPLRSRHIGTAGEPDNDSSYVEYNRLLVAPDGRDEFVAALIDMVAGDARWDRFDLDGFAEEDLAPFLSRLPGAECRRRESPCFDLAEVREAGVEPITRLGKSTRASIRRTLRKYGDLDIEWAETPEQARDIFSELVTLHQARWEAENEPGAFGSHRFRGFIDELITRLHPSGRIVLFRVRHEGETVGALLLLVDRNRLLDYLSGFAPFEKKPSPGVITHFLCMNAALERGFDAYDFLVGEKRHKRNLSTSFNQLVWASWQRPCLKNRAIRALRDVKRTVRAWKNRRGSEGGATE